MIQCNYAPPLVCQKKRRGPSLTDCSVCRLSQQCACQRGKHTRRQSLRKKSIVQQKAIAIAAREKLAECAVSPLARFESTQTLENHHKTLCLDAHHRQGQEPKAIDRRQLHKRVWQQQCCQPPIHGAEEAE